MNAQLPKVQYDLIRLVGGLDQITPTLSLPPGVVRRAANFECSLNGGYSRIAGYERFDGHANPSDARYNVLIVNTAALISVGSLVTGTSTASTGRVIAIAGASIIITRETGIFVAGESLSIGGATVALITDITGTDASGLNDAQYKALAADNYRADIGAVPGEGNILGVAYYNGTVYAWRNVVGGASAKIYKSTASGWTGVALGKELRFTLNTAAFTVGETVTGGTSGATGVIARVVIESGTIGAGTAAGRLILSSSTGTFAPAELLKVATVTKATGAGAATQITLLPNGRVQSTIANFGGGDNNRNLYGCDGVNRAFEFDGTTYVPLTTTMTPDIPTAIALHKQHLFLAFGSSLQFSSIGDPYQWDAVLGAGEIAMNDDITQLLVLPGDQSSGALAVYTQSDMSVLYGSSSENFQLTPFNVGTGGIANTGQNLDQCYILSDRGVMALGTTLNFGNFAASSLTMNLRTFTQVRRTLATASVVNREKGQYRVFFSDGYGLYLTIANGKYMGAMPVQFPDPVLCCVEGENLDGIQTSFFGSDNGMVYRLEAGTSFDGSPIASNLSLIFNSTRSPRILKRYRKASVELTGDSFAEFSLAYDLGYRSTQIEQADEALYSNDLRAAYWDAFTFDNFVFDSQELSPSEVEMTGTAENVAIRISSVSSILKPFTVNSIIVHYTLRRGLR